MLKDALISKILVYHSSVNPDLILWKQKITSHSLNIPSQFISLTLDNKHIIKILKTEIEIMLKGSIVNSCFSLED